MRANSKNAGNDVSWFLGDRIGSVRKIVEMDGTVLDALDYDSFGAILNETQPTFDNRFKFTARDWDDEIDLQYNRRRYYDPEIGRWISEDWLGYAAGDQNFYRYANNSPTTFTDPSGKFYQTLIDMVQAYSDGLNGAVEAYNRGHYGRIIEDFVTGFVGSLMTSATYGGLFAAGGAAWGGVKYFGNRLIKDYIKAPLGFVLKKVAASLQMFVSSMQKALAV